MLLNASILNTALLNGGSSSSGGGGSGGTGGAGGFGGFIGRFVNGLDVARMLDGTAYAVYARVRIADADGVLKDYSTRSGINWVHTVEYEGTIDAPIATATVKLWREVGQKSLAPLKTNSSYNQTRFVAADLSIGTGPAIDGGRRILIDVACIDLDATPVAADWHLIFEGTIDSVDWAENPITIECRDKAAALQDTWFPVPNLINPDPANIQGALAELLDLLHLDVFTPLYVPVLPDPAVAVGAFRYDIEPGMDALQRVAQINAWDLRPRFSDVYQEFRLTFKDPGRDRTDPDFVLYPHSYAKVNTLKIDRTPIRNDVSVSFKRASDDVRVTINEYSPTSVQRYGRRSMVITEGDDSPIADEDSARLMGRLAVFDLAAPIAEKSVEMLYFWPIELHNIIRFPPNLVHSDTPLDLAVVAYKHSIVTNGKARTTLMMRGRPAGSYWRWFGQRPVRANAEVPDGSSSASGFGRLTQTPDFATDHVQFDWNWGGDAGATFELYAQRGTSGFSLEATLAAGVNTYDYDAGVDIEAFNPEAPQLPVYVSFYLIAKLTGLPSVTSGTSYASYGYGP